MKKMTMWVVLLALVSGGAAQAAREVKNPCAFGEDLEALEGNSRFRAKVVGKTFKLSRQRNPANGLFWVQVTEYKDQQTGRVYQLNATFDDAYDGGNTVGWIEDVTRAADGLGSEAPARLKGPGQVMAEIGDSEIVCLDALH
jgi:hypothetical protein